MANLAAPSSAVRRSVVVATCALALTHPLPVAGCLLTVVAVVGVLALVAGLSTKKTRREAAYRVLELVVNDNLLDDLVERDRVAVTSKSCVRCASLDRQ